MKIINLSNGIKTYVDDEDYKYLSQFKWHNANGYAIRNYYLNGKLKKIKMHREIINPPENMVVDHINNNTFDNCKNNLRICTQQQNVFNSRKRKDNISGFKGVFFDKTRNKWQAKIQVNGKRKYLGRFTTAELAHEAYKKASIKYHGKYGKF